MNDSEANRITKEESGLIQNLVERFPMSCACFEPVYDAENNITDFIVLYMNSGLEAIIGLDKDIIAGKNVSDVFGAMSMDCVRDLIQLINQTARSESKACEIKARVFEHIYKVSFLFISETRLLILFEDIHAAYFRKNYHRSIPRDVIQTSFMKARQCVPDNAPCDDRRAASANMEAEMLFLENFKPIEIIPSDAHAMEPYDAAFRDPLTGLYDRVFAMEALHMFVDSNVLPFSVALGDVNGLRTINESLGFHAGDDLLIKVAKTLEDNCRGDDVVARWNDDQYMLLLPHASQAKAQHIIKRLQKELNAICNDTYSLVTFGYATSETECRTAEDLLREAEKWILQKKLLIRQSHRSGIIRLLLSMLHEKSVETEEHSDRIADHCRWIAKKLHLSDEMVDDLVLLSMLHDIGKIGVPDEILNKPGRLTPEERLIINQHPEIGYKIAKTIPELMQVAEYILAHHERWDGTGYPKGLRGEDIPLASRIIAIVDAFDVMITGRKYQAARTQEEAVAELKRCAGTQFDPNIVEVFIQLLAAEG
ncbi:MAG TPA: HD-GYP domain-containing protein [Candidatus Limiplasma sp.]|nr:HD-GYP domain-containing protein [Candidatus Limiplasma sp.]HRX09879.1 HD-GYP domain-containing protein [Candidatus Limiplasma sp.]